MNCQVRSNVKTRRLATVSLVALFFGGMLAIVNGQRATPPKILAPALPTPMHVVLPMQRPGPLHANAVVMQDLAPPRPWLRVDFTLKLDAPTAALYQQMATLMSGYTAVPNDRLNYFSAVNNANNYTITGWGGLLSSVQPIPMGGYLLTVRVEPMLWTNSVQPTILGFDYSEQFTVDVNNNLQYVGFLDPDNGAGKLPQSGLYP